MSAVLQPLSHTDAEREAYIRLCGERLCACMEEWSSTGNFDARAEAHQWRRRMEEAIKGRSADYVRQLEVERNLT